MNIFFLDRNPEVCAQMHCDKHVVKMIIEYAQLMSTAHRMLDGKQVVETVKGRKLKRWMIDDPRNDVLYKASHVNHPSAVWVRASASNYLWLYNMWSHLLREYTFRYGRRHETEKLFFALARQPNNISVSGWSDPPPAMPDDCKIPKDSLASYRNYYLLKKSHFAKWTKRNVPAWYSFGLTTMNLAESIAKN
jgi:hypothetical protein